MTRGEHMREARRKAGLSLRQLGEKSGVQYGTIARIEQGRNNGSLATVELLADALGLSIDAYTGHEVKGEEDDHIGTDCQQCPVPVPVAGQTHQ